MENSSVDDWRTKGGDRRERGGGEWEPYQILLQELTYVPYSNLKAKHL
jgi:hypothetical protein